MKVCLVGHSAAGLLSTATGGSERQTALLARSLAARGHDVALVVTGLEGGDSLVGGVRVRSGWDPHRGRRFIRAVNYRYPNLYRVLIGERADAYYSRGAGYHTPLVMRAARRVGARSVLGLASDRDLYAASGKVLFGVPDPRISAVIGPIAHAGFRRWGLGAADWVAVQNTEKQAAACDALGLRHTVLPNIVEPPPVELLGTSPVRDAIWAGNVFRGRRSKGLDDLAMLAQLLPDVSFTVVGALVAPTQEGTISLLRGLANVDVAGALSHDETQRRIAEHRMVINTSPSEGFSNVMLEGWALGLPSVTLHVNPGAGLLTDDGLGICAGGDLETMAAAIVALLEEPRARAAMAGRGIAYVRETHAPAQVCAAFERLVTG